MKQTEGIMEDVVFVVVVVVAKVVCDRVEKSHTTCVELFQWHIQEAEVGVYHHQFSHSEGVIFFSARLSSCTARTRI